MLTVWMFLSFMTLKWPDHRLLPTKYDCILTALSIKVSGLLMLSVTFSSHCVSLGRQVSGDWGPNLKIVIAVKFTSHKINHFKMYNSVAFSTFKMLFNYHFYEVPKHFHHPERNPAPIKQSLSIPFSPQPQANTNLLSFFMHLPVLDISYK